MFVCLFFEGKRDSKSTTVKFKTIHIWSLEVIMYGIVWYAAICCSLYLYSNRLQIGLNLVSKYFYKSLRFKYVLSFTFGFFWEMMLKKGVLTFWTPSKTVWHYVASLNFTGTGIFPKRPFFVYSLMTICQ